MLSLGNFFKKFMKKVKKVNPQTEKKDDQKVEQGKNPTLPEGLESIKITQKETSDLKFRQIGLMRAYEELGVFTDDCEKKKSEMISRVRELEKRVEFGVNNLLIDYHAKGSVIRQFDPENCSIIIQRPPKVNSQSSPNLKKV